MENNIVLRLLFLSVVIPASLGFQWTSSSQIPEGSSFRACVGERASFPWSFSLSTEEHVISVEWYRATDKGQVIVAGLLAGHFFPTAGQNVTFVPGAGLQVGKVSLAEFGKYSVRVKYDNNGSLLSSQQTALLTMEDAPALAEGQMVASICPEPVLDDATGRLHIQLMCGHFLSLGSRPVSVVWKTPSDHTVASTAYINGTFRLNLPHPTQGGGYYCRLKDPSVASRCIPNVSRLMRGAYIHVDEVQIRLTLLEGGLQGLQANDEKLDREIDRQADVDFELQSWERNLTSEVGRLAQTTQMLLTRTEKLTSDNEILKTRTEKLTSDNQKLKTQTENLTSDNEILKGKTEKLTSDNEILKGKTEKLTSDNEILKARTEKLISDNEKLMSDNEKLKSQTDKLTSDNEKLKTQTDKLTSNNEKLKTQTDKLTSDNEKLKTQTDKLSSDNEKLKTQTAKLTSDNENLKTQTDKLSSDNEKLKTQTDKLKSDNNGLTSQMQSMASRLTAETAKLSSRVDNMATNTKDISTQLSALRSKSEMDVYFNVEINKDSSGKSYYMSVSKTTPIAFNRVVDNYGNGYNAATGKFTTPYAGQYLFLLQFVGSNKGQVYLTMSATSADGSYTFVACIAFAEGDSQDTNDQGFCTRRLTLSKGYQVYVQASYHEDSNPVIWGGGALTTFSGFLIK